jgi:hypothetical protein
MFVIGRLSPPIGPKASAFIIGGDTCGHQSETARTSRSNDDREISSANCLTYEQKAILSRTLDNETAKDNFLYFDDRNAMASNMVLSIRFDDQLIDSHAPTPPSKQLYSLQSFLALNHHEGVFYIALGQQTKTPPLIRNGYRPAPYRLGRLHDGEMLAHFFGIGLCTDMPEHFRIMKGRRFMERGQAQPRRIIRHSDRNPADASKAVSTGWYSLNVFLHRARYQLLNPPSSIP